MFNRRPDTATDKDRADGYQLCRSCDDTCLG